MKIYINRQPVVGPWGGGNKTLSALCEELSKDNTVVYDLEPNIDKIVCFDPRPNKKGVWYQHFLNYKHVYPNTKIVQRVGDVGTHSKPELTNLVKQSVQHSNHIIFPSIWAKDYIKYDKQNYDVVENAAKEIFFENKRRFTGLDFNKEIKLVTHHWSDNPKKGFRVYEKIGNMIQSQPGINMSLTYIGRYNKNFSNDGVNLIDPIDANELSKKLPQYDVYITASLEEAGANHVLEAMACGLPILYRVGGGSINEYCNDYGLEYTDEKIEDMMSLLKNLDNLKSDIKTYNRPIKTIIERYKEIICKI